MTSLSSASLLDLERIQDAIRESLHAGCCEKALALCEQAVLDFPEEPGILRDYAAALSGLARHEEALQKIEGAFQCGADAPNDFLMQGQILACLHRWSEANTAFRRVIGFAPDNLEWKLYLGHIWMSAGNPTYAGQYAREILLLDSNHAEGHALLGYSRLALGNYAGGWPEYDWLRTLHPLPFAGEKPEWEGQSLDGETVLVYAESGLGDTVQYSRFLRQIQERGGRVILFCQRGLGRLLCSLEEVSEVFERVEEISPYDFQVSLIRLPALLNVRKETLFSPPRYLAPLPDVMEKWRKVVEPLEGFRIGIGWRSAADSSRTFPVALLKEIAAIPGVTLVNVQKGEAAEELRAADLPFSVVDLGSEVDDFADTAAVISHLDLMITADISVAHIAGAVGKETLIVCKHGPDWRLCEKGSASSWYPSWQIFKQPTMWDWKGALQNVRTEVEKRLTSSLVVSVRERVSPLVLAREVYRACDPWKAENFLERLNPLEAHSMEAEALRGRVYYAQGRKFDAEQTLIGAYDADHSDIALGKELVCVCYDLGTFDLGITVCYRMLEFAPLDPEISRLLGMLQRAKRAVQKRNLYAQFLGEKAFVFDVGANLGQSTEAFLEAGAGRVTAFDPNPACLKSLHEKFHADARVTVVPKGVGAEPGTLPFSVCEQISGISTFSTRWKEGRYGDMTWNEPHLAEVTTLEGAIAEYGTPDYIKIDVEGFEVSVLAGLERAVPALSFEFSGEFPEATEACLKRLTELGFTEFNAVIGGWKQFLFTECVSAGDLSNKLGFHPDRLLVGDIFAFS